MNAENNHNEDRVEELLKDAAGTFAPPAEVKARVRERLLAAAGREEGEPKRARQVESSDVTSRWRLWRSPWRVAGAASAALAALVFIAVILWPAPLTLAQVKEALDAVEWVHVKYEGGKEEWYAPRLGIRAIKQEQEGYYDFRDYVNGKSQTFSYWKLVHERDMTPHQATASAWDLLVRPLELETEGNGEDEYYDAERHEEVVDGRSLTRFDRYFTDALGERILVQQLWADPKTRLPVRIRNRIGMHTSEEWKLRHREFYTGEYDFPESGPLSVFDMGVPRDTRIVRSDPQEPEAQVALILEAARDAVLRFPKHFRAVSWSDDQNSIELIYWSGRISFEPVSTGGFRSSLDDIKLRREGYYTYNPDDRQFDPDYYLPRPTTTDKVLAWMKTQTPVARYVYDGETSFNIGGQGFNVKDYNADHQPLEIRRGHGLLGWFHPPIHDQWEYASRAGQPPFILEPSDETPEGTIGLRWEFADFRSDFYIAPERDFICLKHTVWRGRDGQWSKFREKILTDLMQLPGGQWIATAGSRYHAAQPERDRPERKSTWRIEVTALSEDEFPADTFNGQKELEKAKERGVEIKTY